MNGGATVSANRNGLGEARFPQFARVVDCANALARLTLRRLWAWHSTASVRTPRSCRATP